MTKLIGIAVAIILLSTAAAAQPFPTKTVRIVVPNPAGGTVDIVARAVAQSMTAAFGQSVIVDVRPGGNTIIGTNIVARAPADGHTLAMVGTSFVTNPFLRDVPYDALRDFAPVARLVSLPYVVAVHPSVPVKSLKELVGLARARPNDLNYASFGFGQLIAESFNTATAIHMTYVPYQGGVQATIAAAGGHAGVLVGPLSDALPYISSGRLRALAVTTAARSDALKTVPAVAESGYPGFDWASWIGAAAPAGTPPAAVTKLNAEMLRGIEGKDVLANLARLSVAPAPLSPDAFGRFLRAEMQRMEKVVKDAHIKGD
ncbi:MAG TPA: tripartite tricarboxylate transporter substrate-binding protein [Burkholderiales bacterium]|nr:tripartite tricarboxylate transporter substrate-binding protein [Burkholderiales bacterium]